MNNYERLRELAEKATPGPWEADLVDDLVTEYGTIRHWEVANDEFWNPTGPREGEPDAPWIHVENVSSEADARFIAAANPDAIRNLLEDLRLTRQERDQEKHKNMALTKENAALRRGQGRAPEPATPEHPAFHHTHPIPDSTTQETP